jgi:hypothetical protein
MLAQAVNAFVTAGRWPLKSHRTKPARRKTSLRSSHTPVSPIGATQMKTKNTQYRSVE